MEIEPNSIFGSHGLLPQPGDIRAVVTRPASSAMLSGSDRTTRKNCGRSFCAPRAREWPRFTRRTNGASDGALMPQCCDKTGASW